MDVSRGQIQGAVAEGGWRFPLDFAVSKGARMSIAPKFVPDHLPWGEGATEAEVGAGYHLIHAVREAQIQKVEMRPGCRKHYIPRNGYRELHSLRSWSWGTVNGQQVSPTRLSDVICLASAPACLNRRHASGKRTDRMRGQG